MREIERLMQRIGQTDDPAARRALLDQHLQALSEQMNRIIGQQLKMKMSMHDDGRKSDAAKPTGMIEGGGMGKMHRQVEQRLDMLERLMRQMIERERAEQASQR